MNFSAWMENLNKRKKHGKSDWIILILLGVLLMVVVWPGGSDEEESAEEAVSSSSDAENAEAASSDTDSTMAEYAAQLEEELAGLLEEMAGVGEVRVMITLQDSGETILEKDNSSSQDSSSDSTVIFEQDGDEVPYVTGQTCPQIQGVVVVAQGAGTGTVSADITDTVMALFGIEAHRVKVLPMG